MPIASSSKHTNIYQRTTQKQTHTTQHLPFFTSTLPRLPAAALFRLLLRVAFRLCLIARPLIATVVMVPLVLILVHVVLVVLVAISLATVCSFAAGSDAPSAAARRLQSASSSARSARLSAVPLRCRCDSYRCSCNPQTLHTPALARRPEAKAHLSAEGLSTLKQTQLAMLKSVWALLREGGVMLYSTCSILACENEQVSAQGSVDS